MGRVCRYDTFFNDLFLLLPKSEANVDMPKSKPAYLRQIQDSLKVIQTTPETSIPAIIQLDCSESYSNLIQIYKNLEMPSLVRELAINGVYDGSRGIYGGLIKNIQLLLLEYCMKIFVKFSLSSITVCLFNCHNS